MNSRIPGDGYKEDGMTLFSWSYFLGIMPRLIQCVPVTLGITAGGFIIGLALALVLAGVQVYQVPVARRIARLYLSFVRGTPILIQLLICNLALPGCIWTLTGFNAGRYWPPITFVIIAYALNIAAFLSETLRAAISGVGAGQQDAAYAAGLTGLQSMFRVILPQAVRIALPGMANSLSGLLKDTSLAFSAAGILDVMGMVTASNAANFRELEGYVGAGIIFFILCVGLERGMSYLSLRLNRGMALPHKRG
jgi:His/Glu/Gln/Arg/opine family amino acid ABC transporter permease subunit